MTEEQTEQRSFLPLGSVVLLKGSVKKLIIVSRASIVEGEFFDYGAAMYPEGMIDSKIAYFTHDSISKIVHEGYTDSDEDLALEILNDAARTWEAQQREPAAPVAPATVPAPAVSDDPFASVRDMGDDDE